MPENASILIIDGCMTSSFDLKPMRFNMNDHLSSVTLQIKHKIKHPANARFILLCDEENGSYGAGNFACLIRFGSSYLLYDSGSSYDTVLMNMQRLKLSPHQIDAVVISNTQELPVLGLSQLLHENPSAKIYVPASSPDKAVADLGKHHAHVIKVSSPIEVVPNVYCLGELTGYYHVQVVIVRTPRGLVLVAESGPPGIEKICHETRILFPDEPILMVLGNLRNAHSSDLNIFLTVDMFQRLKVQKVAPCRCSGELTRKYFGEGYLTDFIDVTAQQVIKI